MFNSSSYITLWQLTNKIKSAIDNSFETPVWVKAELVNLNLYPKSGHCYPELVEKDGNSIKAQIRGNIWNQNFQNIYYKFKKSTGKDLEPGMQLLFLANVTYSPKYGLSVNILDIDPTFTIGQMEFDKKLTLQKLTEQNVLNNNKKLKMPLLLKNLAIISADTSKGFSDFIKTINDTKYKDSIKYQLFTAVLQGDNAITTQIAALEEIKLNKQNFDAVIIIRGGGDDTGMDCYNNYNLSYEIASFPLPILTGIGHSTDTTIVDMVAYKNLKTPTETANYILQKFIDFENAINAYQQNIINYANTLLKIKKLNLSNIRTSILSNTKVLLNNKKINLNNFSHNIKLSTNSIIKYNNNQIKELINNIKRYPSAIIQNKLNNIDIIEDKLKLINPQNILKRGFSVTQQNGISITDANKLKTGDKITTLLYRGKIESTVN